MTASIIALLTVLGTLALAIWRYVMGKVWAEEERVKEAAKLAKEGIDNDDTSKITAGLSGLNR